MFFRGISSIPLRIAYLLTALSFVTTPVHFFAESRRVDEALAIFSASVAVFCLLVGIFLKPRNTDNVGIAVYSLFAWMVHALMSPVL